MALALPLALALVAISSAATADDLVAHRPDLQPGDGWEYRKSSGPGSGTTVREVLRFEDVVLVESVVIEEEADHPTQGRVTSRTEQVVRRHVGDHALVSLGSHAVATVAGQDESSIEHTARAEYDPPLRLLEFPFGVGDEWTARSTERVEREGEGDTERELRYEVTVLRAERVETLAGFFDALVLEARDASASARDGDLERSWWAPDACGAVKREIEQGGELVAVHELTEYDCAAPNLDDAAPRGQRGAPGATVAVALFGVVVAALGRRRRRDE